MFVSHFTKRSTSRFSGEILFRIDHEDGNRRPISKSITLVPVGPVCTRSPVTSRMLPLSACCSASSGSSPSSTARFQVCPSTNAPASPLDPSLPSVPTDNNNTSSRPASTFAAAIAQGSSALGNCWRTDLRARQHCRDHRLQRAAKQQAGCSEFEARGRQQIVGDIPKALGALEPRTVNSHNRINGVFNRCGSVCEWLRLTHALRLSAKSN